MNGKLPKHHWTGNSLSYNTCLQVEYYAANEKDNVFYSFAIFLNE